MTSAEQGFFFMQLAFGALKGHSGFGGGISGLGVVEVLGCGDRQWTHGWWPAWLQSTTIEAAAATSSSNRRSFILDDSD